MEKMAKEKLGIKEGNTMKKALYLLASALVLFACNKQEDVNNEAIPTPAEDENIFSLTVSAPETKTNIAGAEDVQFEEGEQLAIIADGNTVVTLTAQSSGRSVTFQGNIGGATISDGAYIVYPSSYLNGSRKVVYPASNSSSHVVPMAGQVVKTDGSASATTASARLMHIGGIVKVVISDIPSIATAFTFSAKNGDSDVAITGTYDLSFNGSGEPVLSDAASTGTVVSFGVSGGQNEFYIPIPNQECYELTVSVKEGAHTLFTKTSSRSESFGERASFLGLKEVSINPTVQLYSNMTGWEDSELPAYMMSVSDGKATCTMNTLKDQYFRVKVTYPTTIAYVMGPSSSVNENTASGYMNTNVTDYADKPAVKVRDAIGTYTLTYDYTNGTYKIDVVSSSPTLYVVGNCNSWSLSDTNYPLTKAGKWYYILGVNKTFKINYSNNSHWYGVFGYNGSSTTGATPSINGSNFGDDNNDSNWYYASLLYDSENNQYYAWADGKNNTEAFDNLYIKGSWDGWTDPVEMTRSSQQRIWTITRTFNKDTEFKVTDNSEAWWGFSGNMEAIYDNVVQASSDNNLQITVAGTYLIMFNDSTNKYHIVKVSD